MLNLSFIFGTIVSLSFVLKFDVNSNAYQDYFIFHGNMTAAHLYRTNKTINLEFLSGNNFSLYQVYNTKNPFEFAWNGFRINEQRMNLVNYSGKADNLSFNNYTFFSPYIELEKDVKLMSENYQEPLFQYSETNYSILALIVLCIGLVLKSDVIAPKVWKTIVELYRNTSESLPTDEDSYVEMV